MSKKEQPGNNLAALNMILRDCTKSRTGGDYGNCIDPPSVEILFFMGLAH